MMFWVFLGSIVGTNPLTTKQGLLTWRFKEAALKRGVAVLAPTPPFTTLQEQFGALGYLKREGGALLEDVFKGEVEAATGLDAKGTLSLWRNAGPTEDKCVAAPVVGGQGEQAGHLPQLVRLKTDRDHGLRWLPVSWGGRDNLGYWRKGRRVRLQEASGEKPGVKLFFGGGGLKPSVGV